MRMLIAVTSSNYGHIVRIADVAGVAARLARGDENQIVVVQLAPATHIAVTKLEKIDWAIMFASPSERRPFRVIEVTKQGEFHC